jgi:hypothetical protein
MMVEVLIIFTFFLYTSNLTYQIML